MSHPDDPRPPAAPPSAALSVAWLEQTHDLLALTHASGRILWANASFERATGLREDGEILTLAPADWQAGASRGTLTTALQSGTLNDTDIKLKVGVATTLCVRARVCRFADELLWTLVDTTASCELAARAQHQSELLEVAQEFGRLGVWEREIPSGKGRWDRHVFGFWGLDPDAGTPDYDTAVSRIHPDDRNLNYLESTQQTGRYARRFRVIRPDGSLRWLHSQWEVKASVAGQPDRALGVMVDDSEAYELARSLDSTAAQLKLAVDMVRIAVWRHDLATDRLHYNEHGFAVLGIPFRPEGMSLEEIRVLTHPDDLPKVVASAAQALRGGGPVDVETRYRHSDGTWRHLLVRRVVERDAGGAARAFVGVSLDVTEQIERSRRSEQLTRRFEAAARAARVGIWATTLDNGRTEWNEQMYELFDRAADRGPPTLAEFTAQCVHPDDAVRFAQSAKNYLLSDHGAAELEFRIRHRDGRTRWIVMRANVDRGGLDALQVAGIAMDVTDRHEALEALHAASARAALIAQHAGIGTWEAGPHRDSARWDDQMFRLRGLQPRAVAPDPEERLAIVHPDDREGLLDAHPDFNAVEQPTAYEFRVRLPDGSYRWLASRSAVLRDDAGKVVRRVGVNWDITQARSAELARQQALLAERENQAKSQFLSRMSHELRTPLNAVLGFTQLLQLEAHQATAGSMTTKLDHIRAAGEHLLTLIDDVLDLSSLQSGTTKLELQPVPLASAAAQALALTHDLAARQRVTVRAGGLVGTAMADPTRLLQVLLNLLTNAIKYNRSGGEVVVESSEAQDRVRLSVRDTGRGMRPEQLAQLFEPFNRLGMEGVGIEGSGIGLTIVKALVERMGGHIEVSSQPSQGTVFEVTLPSPAEQSGESSPIAAGDSVSPSALPQERHGQLLYIEDNSVNVLLVEELVKSVAGLRIVSEGTGAAGVARARELRPDLILIDMQLPDFDGYEVLRRLRAHPETAGIACIALSANAMPEDIAHGLASGFDDYWTKPIKFKPFLLALERLFPPSGAS